MQPYSWNQRALAIDTYNIICNHHEQYIILQVAYLLKSSVHVVSLHLPIDQFDYSLI
jgi:hypothetical protein